LRNAAILLVDDSSTLLNLVSKALKTTIGVENILTAGNGKEAMKILRDKQIDIIISDWNMPEMDGEELLYEVRNDPALKSTPFIMMTTNSDRDFIVTAIQLGVTNYLVKPFTPSELEEKLRLAWGAFNRRNAPRHAALPKHIVKIKIDGKDMKGQFVDLSQTGALVRLNNDPCLSLFKLCEVTLELIDPQGVDSNTAIISGLPGMIVRLVAENSFHPTSRICHMGLYFNPATMKKELAVKLSKILNWLTDRTPDLIR